MCRQFSEVSKYLKNIRTCFFYLYFLNHFICRFVWYVSVSKQNEINFFNEMNFLWRKNSFGCEKYFLVNAGLSQFTIWSQISIVYPNYLSTSTHLANIRRLIMSTKEELLKNDYFIKMKCIFLPKNLLYNFVTSFIKNGNSKRTHPILGSHTRYNTQTNCCSPFKDKSDFQKTL